jgi:PAS domain S-box-containing protein
MNASDGKNGSAPASSRSSADPASPEHHPQPRENAGQSLFDSAPDIIAVLDLEGRLVRLNRRFEEELGADVTEHVGRSVFSSPLLTRESAERIRLHIQHLMEGQPEVRFEIHTRRKDGEPVPFEVKAVPIKEADRVTAVLAHLRDISARKEKEDALRNSEETSRVLLNAAANAAFLIDTAGTVLAANAVAATRLGMSTEELVGRPIGGFFPPEVAEFRRQKGLEVLRTARPVFFEDESEGRKFSTSVHPICDDRGRVIKLAIYSKDVTEERNSEEERKKLTAQLQQAQKMEAIGTLAGGIAHDFNNLLMAIQGNVSLILFEMGPSHPQHRILANIEKLIRSGADLTSKLLGYARKGKYEARPVDLNELVRETSETFGRMRKDITIYRDLAENLKSIVADRGQVEQVLLNLFVNAADAMPAGGKLILKTRNVSHQDIRFTGYSIKPGSYAELSVSDTGVGMEPDVMSRIFDPFFTTKKMGRGTGLGLASAYGIVKGHNGYIDVESERGKGSVFYVYLPATDRRSASAINGSRKPEPGIGTILLVDDEEAVLEVTAQMIERLGYTVIRAGSGREALERYRQDPYAVSLVILDMIMPEMGGGEVFDRLKKLNPGVKVLLASGYSMQGQAREIINRGCIGFIQKPFTLEDLSIRLTGILSAP